MGDSHACIPPLASHDGQSEGQEFCAHAAANGLDFRDTSPAPKMARCLWNRRSLAGFPGQAAAVSVFDNSSACCIGYGLGAPLELTGNRTALRIRPPHRSTFPCGPPYLLDCMKSPALLPSFASPRHSIGIQRDESHGIDKQAENQIQDRHEQQRTQRDQINMP